ncbi:MAG: calcium/sodium antiporter [Nanobdellota archaeon]
MDVIIFFVSLAALLYGAHLLVTNSSALALRMGVSKTVIGLSVLSIGTSLPEIATSITSFTTNQASVGLGNIVGSELIQITLVLGIVAMIRPLLSKRSTILRYGIAMVGAVLLAYISLYDGVIHWYEGVILCVSYIFFLYLSMIKEKAEEKVEQKGTVTRNVLLIIAGIALTIVGSKYMVSSTVSIANMIGISEYVVSVIIVGLGTSLPELIISGMAAYRKDYGLGVGNLLGSNITDPTFSLGIGAVFSKATVISPLATQSFLYMTAVFVVALGMFYHKGRLSRWQGVSLALLYFVVLMLMS